jgi:hypothetical protein
MNVIKTIVSPTGCLTLTLLVFAGCREKDKGPEIVDVEGQITRVIAHEDGTGEIAATFHSEKQEKEIEGVALVTAETRILINGEPASLADLHEGERIRGQVRSEKVGKTRRYTALTVHADRAQPVGD